MYGIVDSVAARTKHHQGWVVRAIVYSLAATAAGAAAGAGLGAVGTLIPHDVRLAAASVLAVVAVGLGGLELADRPVRLPQRDREAPPPWNRATATRWAVHNGLRLGIGASSRIGFWLWYVIPTTALLSGAPTWGALLYAAYGMARGGSVFLVVLGRRWGVGRSAGVNLWLVSHAHHARDLGASQLVAVGLAVAVAVGI